MHNIDCNYCMVYSVDSIHSECMLHIALILQQKYVSIDNLSGTHYMLYSVSYANGMLVLVISFTAMAAVVIELLLITWMPWKTVYTIYHS